MPAWRRGCALRWRSASAQSLQPPGKRTPVRLATAHLTRDAQTMDHARIGVVTIGPVMIGRAMTGRATMGGASMGGATMDRQTGGLKMVVAMLVDLIPALASLARVMLAH